MRAVVVLVIVEVIIIEGIIMAAPAQEVDGIRVVITGETLEAIEMGGDLATADADNTIND